MTDEHLIAEALRQENERLRTENKLLKSAIKQINSIGLIEENERLKADNDRIQNNFIQQLEYEKQALDDAIKYKTCLQEIKEMCKKHLKAEKIVMVQEVIDLIEKAEVK